MKKHLTFRIIFLLASLLIFGSMSFAQSKVQYVKGVIRDQISQEPLIGASVQLVDSNLIIGTITDFDGVFLLKDVPVGRIRLQCDYLGYERYITPSFILNTAKVPSLEIELKESNIQLEEVVVRAEKNDQRTQNEMALLSGRSFSAEETERYAGSIADPSRMAISFAGVQASNDLDNDIVVRGNSSVGVLWRLEGIDIPNPNHFARRGSSGGGISIFSVNMLRNSDFIFGNMPAEYGNALSSVFDMKFRKGNNEKREYSLRAGLLGLDAVAEGPISQGRSSYLVNYRYSTLGLLNQMGMHVVDKYTDNTFSDLAYHLHFTSDDNKNIFQLWGVGGLSSEIHHPVEDIQEIKEYEDLVYTDFSTRMGVTGMNWTRILDNESYLKMKVAFMGDHITHAKDEMSSENDPLFLLNEIYNTSRLTAAVDYTKKISSNTFFKAGISNTSQWYDLYYDKYDRVDEERNQYIDDNDSNQELHSYLEGSTILRQDLQVSGGFHFIYHSLNSNSSIEPRLALSYSIQPGLTIALAYGIYSQVVPLGTYFTSSINNELPLMQSQQWTASISKNLGANYTINVEPYYQSLNNIPVAEDESIHYWMLNDLVGYSEYALTPQGKGRNYGVDISLERSFENGFFGLGAVSFYRSTYSLDGENFYSSRYDGKFNTSLMLGKEIYVDNEDQLQLGLRNLWYGGQWYAPDDVATTRRLEEYIEDISQPLLRQNDPYLRTDVRIAYRKNLYGKSWTLSLDIQNVFNRKNTRGEIWNIQDLKYEHKLQAGIIPVISYQLDF
ncbi:MAG: TonB-dependent receptor [Saprospiraceae bacterium]|nr:TonB-dependent receptor [Saprospiraceae bacterium]